MGTCHRGTMALKKTWHWNGLLRPLTASCFSKHALSWVQLHPCNRMVYLTMVPRCSRHINHDYSEFWLQGTGIYYNILHPKTVGTTPQDGTFRGRFPVRSLEIFKCPVPYVHIQWPWGPLSLYQKWAPRNFLGGKMWPEPNAETSVSCLCRMSKKGWKPKITSPS